MSIFKVLLCFETGLFRIFSVDFIFSLFCSLYGFWKIFLGPALMHMYLLFFGDSLSSVFEIMRMEADRIGASPVTADAASRTEKTRAVLARAVAAAEYISSNEKHNIGADKTRRRAARQAGAVDRAPGVGGGNQGGYPVSFLRTLELKLTLRCCRCNTDPYLNRAAELAARTTQFNTAVPQPQDKARALLERLLASGGEVRTSW